MVSRAISGVVLAAAPILGFAAGMTWSAFSSATSAAGNSFTAAASFAPKLVQQLGTATCGGTTSSVTVPGTGAAAGNTVVVAVALRGTTAGAVTVTDSRGNTYAQDVDATNANVRTLVFSGRLDTALTPGDAITISHPFSDDAQAVAVAEFSGIASTSRTEDAAGAAGNGTTPGATVTTADAERMVFAAVANPNTRTYSDDPGWAALADVTAECGGGVGRATLHTAYRVAPSAGSWPYGATLNIPDRWAATAVAYRH